MPRAIRATATAPMATAPASGATSVRAAAPTRRRRGGATIPACSSSSSSRAGASRRRRRGGTTRTRASGARGGSTPIIPGATRSTEMRTIPAFLAVLALASAGAASAQEFRLKEVAAVTAVAPAEIPPRTIIFSDHKGDELADPGTGLVRFEDWERARPLQKQLLALHPAYVEPTVNVTLNGVTKPYKKKLHMYVAEARF